MSERCKREVADGGRSVRFHRCSRNAIDDGYCKQHHPNTIAERRDKSDARYAAKRESDPLRLAMKRIAALEADLKATNQIVLVQNAELQKLKAVAEVGCDIYRHFVPDDVMQDTGWFYVFRAAGYLQETDK
jgi:hypothetical protein